jgi:TPR repeat protein
MMLLDGRCAAPSYIEAAALFTVAAEENIPQSLYSLALMYEYGQGVEQNYDLAMKYYRQGAEQNHVESMYNLALMYAFGRGGEKDFQRARPLLEVAAAVDHAPSIYYIGVFKTYGYGCQVNYDQAINWFERAAGIDDFRVSVKAAKAAEELRVLVDGAHLHNNEKYEEYQAPNGGVSY